MKSITLYAKDVKGNIREWSCLTSGDGLIIEHGLVNGGKQHKTERVVPKGNKTMEEQVIQRYYSRCNAQYDKGYVETLSEAEGQARTNSAGLLRPMLAQPYKNVKEIDYTNAFYQHKYDGNRCLVTKRDGITIAYSRNGKFVTSIDHITDTIKLNEGETIDGELYCHGVSLQTICSWIKREQDATKSLELRVYDLITDKPYYRRVERLHEIDLGGHAFLAETTEVRDSDEVDELMTASLTQGYEGGIVRWGDVGYEDGKRSKSLVKIKLFEDDEFIIVDVLPSKDGWARFECETNEGNSFMVSAPGTMSNRYKIMEESTKYLGRMVTVKYANMTKDGIPFHPVATNLRDDL